MKKLSIRPIVEAKNIILGEAVVSSTPISFFGAIDSQTGKITDPGNSENNKSIKNKIFVFPEGRGSTVGSYVIYGLAVNNVAPLALVANHAETIVIVGAILGDIPLVDQPSEDILKTVETGDEIEIDTKEKTIKIIKKIGF